MNLILALVSIVYLGGDDSVQKANSIERIIRFEYRVINQADRAQDINIHMALPQDNERQEVLFLEPEPGYREILKDRYGNRILHYLEEGMKPGEVRTRGWIAAVRMHAAVFLPSKAVHSLTPELRAHYTKDRPNYLINSPAIRKVRDSIVKEEMPNVEKSFSIYKYLINHITYYRDDHWDSAPVVLKNGKGSCSEFNYCFISLLRSCGIPCRYTGGFILTTKNGARYDQRIHEDAVFHRWTEIFLSDRGWFPADASRGSGAIKRFDNFLNLWGRLPSGSLQSYRGDGGKDSYIGWNYIASARGEAPLRKISVGYWVEVKDLEEAISGIRELLKRGVPKKDFSGWTKESLKREVLFFQRNKIDRSGYPDLIEALHESHHPSAIYYSVYCKYLGVDTPSIQFPLLVDEYLKGEISRHLGSRDSEKCNWGNFEYWWRKARPEIYFDVEKKVFVLGNRNINIY